MSLVLAALLAATPAGAAPSLAHCSWNRPGHNPFMGDVVAAVDRYQDIPPAVRERLKTRMASRAYDEIVSIRRDAIVGKAGYGAEIRDMHFGTGQVCGSVDRAAWAAGAQERGLVYCEAEHCILVPTVCRNVSRISRSGRASPAVAGAAGAAGAAPAGTSGKADDPAGAATTATTAATGPTDRGLAALLPAEASALHGLGAAGSAPGAAVPANEAAALAAAGDAGGAGVSSLPWLGGAASDASWLSMAGAVGVAAGLRAADRQALTDRQISALPATTRGALTDAGLPGIELPPIAPAVPEPASLLLWLAGLAALGHRCARRRPGR